jgi:hypothetical protein
MGRKYQSGQFKSKPGSASDRQGGGFADLDRFDGFGGKHGGCRCGGRRGFEELAERPFEDLEVDEIDGTVVVEVAVGEEFVGLAEVGAEDAEVGRVDRSVVVGVGDEGEEVEDVVGGELVSGGVGDAVGEQGGAVVGVGEDAGEEEG